MAQTSQIPLPVPVKYGDILVPEAFWDDLSHLDMLSSYIL